MRARRVRGYAISFFLASLTLWVAGSSAIAAIIQPPPPPSDCVTVAGLSVWEDPDYSWGRTDSSVACTNPPISALKLMGKTVADTTETDDGEGTDGDNNGNIQVVTQVSSDNGWDPECFSGSSTATTTEPVKGTLHDDDIDCVL